LIEDTNVIFAIATFVLILAAVLGSYWALVLRPESQASGRLRERLNLKAARPKDGPSIIKGAAGNDEEPGTLLRWHRRYAIGPATRLIARSGMQLDAERLVMWTLGALSLVVVVLRAVNASWVTALCAGMATPLVPYAYLTNAVRKRLKGFEELFPEALDLMARALRGGHTLTTALAMIADEIPDPVKAEFRAVYEQHNYGLPMPQVLRGLADRIPLMDVRFFVTAVITQRETGGNLAEVLDNLAAVTRDRFRVRRHIQVLTAQGRMTGWILGLFPVGLGVVLYLVNPTHMGVFVTDPLGFRLLETAAALQVAGFVMIRKIVQVEF
jgi:tight adherence protein B